MISIWRHISILVPIIILTSLIMLFSTPEEEIIERDYLLEMYEDLESHITPRDYRVYNTCRTVLGLNWDANLTDTDIILYQEWISNNIDFRDVPLKYPNETLRDGIGNHLSFTLLEYSMILQESPNSSFILIIDLKYDSDIRIREHSATLTFFGDKAFLSDSTIPKDKLSYVCRLNKLDKVITDIIENTYIIQYDVKYALSKNECVSFQNNVEFFDWMIFKVGYI